MTIDCPSCGAEHDPAEEESTRCIVCGQDLADLLSKAPTSPPASTEIAEEPVLIDPEAPEPARPAPSKPAAQQMDSSKLAAALSKTGPAPSSKGLDELHAVERRSELLLALVPVYGFLRASQSEVLSGGQKTLAYLLSIATTALLSFGAWAIIPQPGADVPAPKDEVATKLVSVQQLVLAYREQAGELPDEETWKRSVDSSDSQLFDPWGKAFVYRITDDGFEVGTFGRDGDEGGDGEDADQFVSFTESSP